MEPEADLTGAAVPGAIPPEYFARLIETNGSAFLRLDNEWRFKYVNRRAEALLRRSREDLLGKNIWDEWPQGPDSVWRAEYQRAVDTGKEVTFEANFAPIGAWFEVRATPDDHGLSVFFLDVSARRRAYDRLALVAEITRVLVGNRDVESVAATLAAAVVPELATWAMVSLYDDEGRLYEAAAAHRDPDRAADVALMEQLHPQMMRDMPIVGAATSSGAPEIRHGLAGHIRSGAAAGRELFQVLERLGCDSVMILPLRARERALGVLALFQGETEDGRQLDDELETAVGLADRAGLALENAQLYSRQRRAAEVLQRSLLTPLPQPDHLHLVARYLPAAEGTEVGGDWYDAFLQPDGATVLVIGDIVGHDIAAAAAMGQLRNLLRGTAYDRGDGPAELLVRLDALITGLGIDTLATLLVARLEQTPEQEARDERTFRWSNAGHPPPMVRRADGTVEVLDQEADVPLGLDQRADRHEHTTLLRAGDTLLLYTDGLIERKDRSLTTGLSTLANTLAELRPVPLEGACDALLARMLPERGFDDVAVLALHAYPGSAPRPPEAGPEQVPTARPETSGVADPMGEVVLLDIPLDLRDRVQQHSDELVREMALVSLQIDGGEGRDLPVRLTQLVAEVQANYGAFSASPDAELDAAGARGDATAQVVYHVPLSVGPYARHLIDILEETDEFCRQGTYLLALASPPDIHAYRIWALREFERQLAGEPPTPWTLYAEQNGVPVSS